MNSTYASACASGFGQSFVQSVAQITLRNRWKRIGPFDGIYSAINGIGHCIAEMGKHSQGIESSSLISKGIDLGVDLATRPLTTLLHNRFLIRASTPLKLQITNKLSEIKQTFTDLKTKPDTFKLFLEGKENQITGTTPDPITNENVQNDYYQITPFADQLKSEPEPFNRPEYKESFDNFIREVNALINKEENSVKTVCIPNEDRLRSMWSPIEVVPPESVPKFQKYLSDFRALAAQDAAYWEGIETQFNTHSIPVEKIIPTYTKIFDLLSKGDVNTQDQKKALDAIFRSPSSVPPSTLNSLVINSISSVLAGLSIDVVSRNIPAGNISAPFDAGQAICTPDQQPAVNASNATHKLLPEFSNECDTSQQLTARPNPFAADPNPWKAPATIMASALTLSGVWLACLAAIQLATNQELSDKERKKRTLQVVGGCGLACTGIGAFAYASI